MVFWLAGFLGYNAPFWPRGPCEKELEDLTVSQLNKTLSLMAAALSLVVSMSVGAASDLEAEMAERLKPVGDVCMSGDDCAAAPVAAASTSGPRSGGDVYDSKCATCHAIGVAGAPKFGDAAAWGPRIGKGVDVLYTSAISGFNGMPAKGMCFDCSDDEIKAAVDHMVDASK